MNRIIGFIFLVFLLSINQQALALVITSPNNGDIFKEGDTVKIVAELSNDDPEIFYVDFNVTKGLDHCPNEIATHPRYECNFIIPSGSPQLIKISAIGKKEYGAISSPWISINVILPHTVNLQQLKSFAGNTLFFFRLGQNNQIYLKGLFSDGVERDLELASTGTTYTSNNENIAIVSSDGLVTAKGSGKAQVTVRNNDKTLVLDVKIEIKLNPPANLIAKSTDAGIQLDWKLSPQAPEWVTGYMVFRTEDPDGVIKRKIADVPNGTTTYIDTTAVKGKTYYYGVQAISATANERSSMTNMTPGVLP